MTITAKRLRAAAATSVAGLALAGTIAVSSGGADAPTTTPTNSSVPTAVPTAGPNAILGKASGPIGPIPTSTSTTTTSGGTGNDDGGTGTDGYGEGV